MKKSSGNFVIFAYFEKHFPETKKIEKKMIFQNDSQV